MLEAATLAVALLACDRTLPADELVLVTTPASGSIGKHDFVARQTALQRSKYGATLVLLDDPVPDPCSIDALYTQRRFAFMVGLGPKQPPTGGLDVTQLGRDDSVPENKIGRRFANYYRPSKDATGAQSLGYGGGSYHLVLDTFDPNGTATGRIAIGRFAYNEAHLAGTFTAKVCPVEN